MAGYERNQGGTALGALVVALVVVGGLYLWSRSNAEQDEPPVEAASESTETEGETAEADSTSGPPSLGIPAPDDVAEVPADAARTESGLASRVLREGTGRTRPGPRDRVTVHYTGWTTDGRAFDSSRERDEPATFALHRVIAGWTEGVQLMLVGEQRRLWIPAELAYRGRRGAPQGMLVFDIELIEIEAVPAGPNAAPPDVAGPPPDAEVTASGLAHRRLAEGAGTEHPSATSRVLVNYTGWTIDGRMFDSTNRRGQPVGLGLDQVIPGWTEGLQLMVAGERRRFWIPEALAYAGRPGAPAGMLVFDIELLEIRD